MSKRSAAVVLSLTLSICLPVQTVLAAGPAPGQLIVTFSPHLTGDPEQDFTKSVQLGDTLTVFVIAGALSDSLSNYRFSLQFSQAATMILNGVRASGNVLADQNSIGTVVLSNISFPANDCFKLPAETVIAEIDLTVGNDLDSLSINLIGWNGPLESPDFMTCAGTTLAFDHSASPTLSLHRAGAVGVEDAGWSAVKYLYR